MERVSVHGGHSGQFCCHASGSLEDIVKAYIRHGFSWVGITEHIPPHDSSLLYPEEAEAGMTIEKLSRRFTRYFGECRRLQQKYAKEITLYAAMEIETWQGYEQQVGELINTYKPDYIVGSVHHIDNIPIDYSMEKYEEAVQVAGGIENLYCRYFDLQYEMIRIFEPAVVGHFDLIRIYDSEYRSRLNYPAVAQRVERNLQSIKELGLILDYNLRSLLKGAVEPYVSQDILRLARQKNIAVVPGDDSHGVENIALNIDKAMADLGEAGFSTAWQRPVKNSGGLNN